jgi:large subunit ribosomal protein L15
MHSLRPAKGAKHYPKRLGRGNASGKGTTAGRGGKGQTARSGGTTGLKLMGMRHLMLSSPKLRGFKSIYAKAAEVSLAQLGANYADGETVTLPSLKKKKLVPAAAKKAKVLNNGAIAKRITLKGIAASEGAKAKIVAAGGEVA